MKRPILKDLVASALLTGLVFAANAAGAGQMVMLNGNMPTLGVTTTAPPSPNGFTPAPTPNQDLRAPTHPQKAEAEFGPGFAGTQNSVEHPGQGYTAGSSYTDDLGRRHPLNPLGVTPTLSLKVPLE